MNVHGTMVKGTVLQATEFRDLLCARYNVTPPPPPTSRATATAVASPLMYATQLAAAKEAWLLHVTTESMVNSYTLLDEP